MLGHCAQSIGGALPGGRPFPSIRSKSFFVGSSTFTAPIDAEYTFYLQGAGGSGNTSDTASFRRFGAGGGLCVRTVSLKAGDQVSVTLGAGGQGRSGTGAGNNGAASTVRFPSGLTLQAGPGAGGPAPSADAPNAVGGTASGGDININGASDNTGRSGSGLNPNINSPIPSEPKGTGYGGAPSSAPTAASESGDRSMLTVLWLE